MFDKSSRVVLGDWEQRLSTALVKSSPTDLMRTKPSGAVSSPAIPNDVPRKRR